MKIFVMLAALLSVACGNGGGGGNNNEPVPTPTDYLFIGDSHTTGPGFVQDFQDMFDPGDVIVLERGDQSTGKWVPSADLLWQGFNVDDWKPTSAILFLGRGDASYFPMTSPRVYKMNLEEMAMRLLDNGAEEVVLLTTPRPHPDEETSEEFDFYRRYEGEIKDLCDTTTEAIVCGPNLYRIINPKRHLGEDGVHLNDKGNKIALWALENFFNL